MLIFIIQRLEICLKEFVLNPALLMAAQILFQTYYATLLQKRQVVLIQLQFFQTEVLVALLILIHSLGMIHQIKLEEFVFLV
jgi:hypothetical protein